VTSKHYFKEILDRHQVQNADRVVQPSPQVAGWSKKLGLELRTAPRNSGGSLLPEKKEVPASQEGRSGLVPQVICEQAIDWLFDFRGCRRGFLEQVQQRKLSSFRVSLWIELNVMSKRKFPTAQENSEV